MSNVLLRYDDSSHGAVPYSITLRIRSLHLQNGDAPDAALAALAAKQPDDPGCSFKWSALGCVPSDTCRLQWKPRLGTLGPCVLRAPPAVEPEPACNSTEGADAEPTKAEAEPAAEAPAMGQAEDEEVSVDDAEEA